MMNPGCNLEGSELSKYISEDRFECTMIWLQNHSVKKEELECV